MKGLHKVIVQNNRLHYEFDIRRNITIIQGNSATGKTTLINMLRQAENLGADSGVDVNCDVPCRVLEGRNWKVILESISKSIIFIDEENVFINTEEFASAIQNSDNYYVLIRKYMACILRENTRIHEKYISRCTGYILTKIFYQ